jgi:hypothetical protein
MVVIGVVAVGPGEPWAKAGALDKTINRAKSAAEGRFKTVS